MSKDFFQRNAQIVNELRTEQFKIRQYIQKGKYRMKPKFFNKGKKHYDFDLNSQQYFHQELYDLAFEPSETQQQYAHLLQNYFSQTPRFHNQYPYHIEGIPPPLHQSQVRHLLHRFFSNRVHDLEYQKYLIMERLHNIQVQEQFAFVKSRVTLIDKEITMALSRAERLACEENFQEAYTVGSKPVPVNESGQSIYKYLDEEDCWFSNIQRDDILIYTRNKLFKRDILHNHYYPLYYEHKYLVKIHGLDILLATQQDISKEQQRVKEQALKLSRRMIQLFEEELELISPGNLVEKQNISTFIYNIYGMEEGQLPLSLSLYPALHYELIDNYNKIIPCFFKSLQLKQHKDLISLLPKFNNFCSIVFKYQNKEVLEGKQEVKLGLEDDIDIKKELYTMLEEIWTTKYVKIDFSRFDIRYRLRSTDWPLDSISQEHARHNQHRQASSSKMVPNTEVKTLINILKSTNYSSFRKHIKRHSETVIGRLKDKYSHMERINKYNILNNQEHTLEQLGQFFRIKFNQKQTHSASILKSNASVFFEAILAKQLVTNPVEIQIQETLRVISLREMRVKLVGILNGMRCYHRNLALDLRVLSQVQFKFHLDDELLINSNKQAVQNFQKAIKDTQTYFSKETGSDSPVKMNEEQFVQHQAYERSKLYKKDRVIFEHYGEQIPHVMVKNGERLKNSILYEVTNTDLEEIQERLLFSCTSFINRYERYLKVKTLDQLVDRVDLLSSIYKAELQYQFEKLKLIQSYYYIYENTKEPLAAFKISQTIVKLIYQQPKIDAQEPTFDHSYRLAIEALQQERQVVILITKRLQKVEEDQCRTFHDKYARKLNIPLTTQAYLYGDIKKKQPKERNKLQRMSSFSSSKLSKESRIKDEKQANFTSEIKEQYPEIDEDEEEQYFDLQKYDQYLLRKNMDAIFDDMMGQEGNVKEAVPVSTIAIENLVVNPRFQGGPHIKVSIFPNVHLTSRSKQNLVNFSQVISVVGNIHNLIQDLKLEFQNDFGYVSTLYQQGVIKNIINKMKLCCLSPQEPPPSWMTFETDDPYYEVVSKSTKYYEQMMGACLQPPSNVQLQIKSTFDRHHQKLPMFGALQYFDYHSLSSLILLKKPTHVFRYKQHSLALGFIELLQLQDRAWLIQLERRGLSAAYGKLAKYCQMSLDRSVAEYTNTGQSEVFLATQQNKLYNNEATKFAIYPDMLDEIRQYFSCELADIEVFRKYLEISKRQLMDLLIMKFEVDKNFQIKRLDKNRLLAPNDPKDMKKIKNRILGIISVVSADVLKNNTFLKYKASFKASLEQKLKMINQEDYESRVENKQKMSPFCVSILTSKYKRHKQIDLLRSYSQDLLLTASKLNTCTETLTFLHKLHNYAVSVPFLSTIFTIPNEQPLIDSKVLYDQGKPKHPIPIERKILRSGQIADPYYIFISEQYLNEWMNDNNFPVTTNIDCFNHRTQIQGLQPPKKKQDIFKWAFRIPELKVDQSQTDATNHLLKTMQPFTGKLSPFSYMQTDYIVKAPSRNKYMNLMEHYKSLVDYIEANILLISLQVEDDILESLEAIIKKQINFEERYFITDQNSIRQTINTLQNKDLSVVYKFVIDFTSMNYQIAKKMEDRHYIDKKQHWVVHDQIIDFVMSKIQGYGVIRQSYLPLCDDLKQLKHITGTSAATYLSQKTSNIYKILYLAAYETYLNEINEPQSDFYAYHSQINQWLCHSQKLQQYSCAESNNKKIDLAKEILFSDQQKSRFNNGIYLKDSNKLNDRLKYVIPTASHLPAHFIQKLIYKEHSINQDQISYCHNWHFIGKAFDLFKSMGEKNRFKVFARTRYHYDLADQFLSTRSNNLSHQEKQFQKSSFFDLLINKKVFTLACISFSARITLPMSARLFKDNYMELKEINQIQTHNLFENLQRFREENKIQFSKWETQLIGKNENQQNKSFNHLIREVLTVKLLKEEFRYRIYSEAVRIIKAQKAPKTEPKRIMNPSLIPRVHLISSYSSPLILDRKTYISQQYKLSFLQAFINRFRNKVSRVDLLSSGYGFVITVPDLEDCVNYMNKLLFTFTEKQFKYRIETFSQYAEIMIEAINSKNKKINEQSALIKYLQHKNNNLLEAEYLGKVTKILHQKTLLEDKLLTVQNNINGLEDRVRKTVQIQYDKKIAKLENQNQELREIFSKVKHLHMVNTREAAKNNYLDVMNFYKDKINDILNKKIDFTISFEDERSQRENNRKVEEEDNSNRYRKGRDNEEYVSEDLNRCKLGEDIVFDPYYTTKLINKMRLFNLFRLGSKRIKFQTQTFRKDQKLGQLNKVQDMVVTQSERQVLVRNELKKVQEELSRKCLQLDKLKTNFDMAQNEKTKLKILMQSKQKKIEQRERQIEELRQKIEEKDKSSSQIQSLPVSQERKKPTDKSDDVPKLSVLRKQKKYKKTDRGAFLTHIEQESSPNTISLLDRFQLSNKDGTWRDKCQQLYIENKKLQIELEKYHLQDSIPSTPKREGFSLNMRARRESASEQGSLKSEQRFPNISFKYNLLKQ